MSTKRFGNKLAIGLTEEVFGLLVGGVRLSVWAIITALRKLYPELSPDIIRRRARYLRGQGYLEGDARLGYALTDKGLERMRRLSLPKLRLNGEWDKRWRIIVFDIPEERRDARAQVRRLIKQLGFRQLQQSVWIHPLPCLEEFEQIRQAYGKVVHILLLEVEKLEVPQGLVAHFQRQYSAVLK